MDSSCIVSITVFAHYRSHGLNGDGNGQKPTMVCTSFYQHFAEIEAHGSLLFIGHNVLAYLTSIGHWQLIAHGHGWLI
jgi:hypothetical protein